MTERTAFYPSQHIDVRRESRVVLIKNAVYRDPMHDVLASIVTLCA